MTMNDLKIVETTNEVLSEMITDGSFKEIIRKQLNETITNIASNAMRSYSDFGKALESKINEVVHTAAHGIQLPEYNKFVSDIVVEEFDKVLNEQSKTQIQEALREELGELRQDVISCSDIQNRLQKIYESSDYQDSKEIKVCFENDGDGWAKLTIESEDDSEKITVRFTTFHKQENYSYIGWMETGDWSTNNTATDKYGFGSNVRGELTKYLYRLYCAKSKIDLSDWGEFEDFTVGGYH